MDKETKPKPLVIHIHGRRWFDKVNGNTYHTATIWVDGVDVHKVPFQYGYGEQYAWNAAVWLKENGFLPNLETYENGNPESLWQWCNRNNVKLITEVDDLPRKKDLER